MSDTPLLADEEIVASATARKALAALRIVLGFVFLWAFLDRTLGLGYSTAPEDAWIRGGSPVLSFVSSSLEDGKPFTGIFRAIANPGAGVLFMLGLLGIGLALVLGIATRLAAACGVALMALLWLATFPPVTVDAASAAPNPLVDAHVVYALALVVVAATRAGDAWGLGRRWRRLGIVRANPWLL